MSRHESPLHRLPAHVKVVALLVFALTVVAIPRDRLWVHGVHLAVVGAALVVARVPRRLLARGLLLELPFVAFALLLPFVATGPTTSVLGVTLSQPGLAAAASLLAKATLGVLAALTLAATTRAVDLLDGLRRLRLPGQLVDIMGFMVRYVEVVGDQWRRMGVARASRGFTPTSPRSWRALGASLGTLFISSYERGERVHLAMLSRGHEGHATRPRTPA